MAEEGGRQRIEALTPRPMENVDLTGASLLPDEAPAV
jgi:hypothetical protein